MTKKFCDMCETPVDDRVHSSVDTEVPFGKPYLAPALGSIENREMQCCIAAVVHFGFRKHPTGFGGPPDLCPQCKQNLIWKVWDSLKPTQN